MNQLAPTAEQTDSHDSASALSRRQVLVTGGVVVAAVAVTAACGSSSSTDSASTTSPASTPPASSPAGAGAVATLATTDVPVGGGTILADQLVVVTQPTAGTFKAFTAVCTHLGCTVSSVAGGTIDCGCHGSKYSIVDGSVKGGPAPKPLAAIPVTVSGTTITVE